MANSAEQSDLPVSETAIKGNTLEPIEINVEEYRKLEYSQFVDRLFTDLRELKDRRFHYYNGLRSKNQANTLRWWLSRIASLAVILTTFGTLFRIASVSFSWSSTWDIWIFAIALLAYGVMGAFTVFESTQDISSSYFRHLGVTFAIRDLWTKFEFAYLKEVLKGKVGDAAQEMVTRDQLIILGEAFCKDLGKLVTSELGEWKAEFIASISELDTIAKKGDDATKTQLQTIMKEYQSAKEKAEQAAKEAAKPTFLNITINGDFDEPVVVRVNNSEKITTTKRSFAIDSLLPGIAKVEAVSKKNGEPVLFDEWINLQPGIQSLKVTLQ